MPGRMAFLDGESALAGRTVLPAVEEAGAAGFVADALEFGKGQAIEADHVFEADLGHQVVDVDVGRLLGRHARGVGVGTW